MYLDGQTTMEKLPESILLEIMQYLHLSDRCRARRVCKSWNQIISGFSLWRHIDLLEYRLDLNEMWTIVRCHLSPRLLTLKIRGNAYSDGRHRSKVSLSDAMLKQLSACCPNLRLLHLNECQTLEISFDSLPPSITCLEMISDRWCPRWMENKQMHLPNLVHLSLDKSVRVDDFDLEDIAVWKNLKYLSLELCVLIEISGIITIAEHLSKLEYLNLTFVRINDLGVEYIAQHLKKLKELCLARCESVTDRAVDSIMGLPMLNRLDISNCERVTMRALESLFISKPSVLIVDKSACFTEAEKQALKKDFPESFILVV